MVAWEPRIEGGLLVSFEGYVHEEDSEPFHPWEKKASGDKMSSHICGQSYPVSYQPSMLSLPREEVEM